MSNKPTDRKPLKSKTYSIILALILGACGVHRFYLGQNKKGFVLLLLCWTIIPFTLGILDALAFLFMSKEKFNHRYNKIISPDKSKYCPNCFRWLIFWNSPMWGNGKLNDGTRVCHYCFVKMNNLDDNFTANSQYTYDTLRVQHALSGESLPSSNNEFKTQKSVTNYSPSIPPPTSPSSKTVPRPPTKPPKRKYGTDLYELTYAYYILLKGFSSTLSQLVRKLQTDEAILSYINPDHIRSSPEDFIANCVVYDMIQVTKIITDNKLFPISIEGTGLVLASHRVLPEIKSNLWKESYDNIAISHKKRYYKETVEEYIAMGSEGNPLGISIRETSGNEIISTTEQKNSLAFPAFLKISDNDLFEEYATVLYRFATIISKADNIVTAREEKLLKEIYEITHHPNIGHKNDALNISKGEENESLEEVLEDLHSLIGLNEVKAEINTLINFIKVQKAREETGLKASSVSYHIVFTGNPGTGKTTVARIVAKIYKHLGILNEGHLVETDRAGLIAEYAGQTAVKVNNTVNKALNGVLFIDEAYSLVGKNKDDYGREAVATLIKRMEDDRDKLVLILAGYTKEMNEFTETNPGIKSRFNRYIEFPDYTPSELLAIFESSCERLEYHLEKEAREKLKSVFENAYANRDKSFGNGRLVRNIFEKTIEQQANRIARETDLTKEILTTIIAEDVNNSIL